jgi:tubulin monoglycylase TTLL3/8
MTLDPVFSPPFEWPNNNKFYVPDNLLENLRFELVFDEVTEGKQIRELFKNQKDCGRHFLILFSKNAL